MIAIIRAFFAASGIALFALLGLLGWNAWTYHRLTDEAFVAELSFARIDDQQYLATLHPADAPATTVTLAGDDWQLDARLVTWMPWAQLLGADPLYRLDRISGRFRDVEQARAATPSVHALTANPGLDLWAIARDGGDWLPGVDAAYGTAVFLPMADGARYRVSLSSHGLVARPYNQAATSVISTWY